MNGQAPVAGTTTGRRPPLVLIFAITATSLMGNALITPTIPDIVEDLGAQKGVWNGLLVMGGALPGIVVAPVIGVLADQRGRRPVLVACLVLFGVFGGAGAAAPNLPILLVLRVGQGVGSAGLINLAVVVVSDHWQGIDRARVIGWNAAVLTATVAVWPAIGGALADALGWRWVFALYPLSLLTAVAVWRWLPSVSVVAGGTMRERLVGAAIVSRRRELLTPILLGALAFVGVFGLMLVTLPSHLDDEFGLSAAARGRVLAVPALGSMAAALSLGRLRRRVPSRRLAGGGLGMFAVAFAVMGAAPTTGVIAVVSLAYGLGEGVAIPSMQDQVAEAAPPAIRGSVLAFFSAGARAGQALGSLLFGVLLGVIDERTAFFGGAAVFATVAVAALAWVEPAPHRRVEPSEP